MQTSRILLPILALVVSASSHGAAQELKTVSECRAYRKAWFTSVHKDIQQLSVKELVSRAQKMVICAGIDKETVEQGMNCQDALKASAGYMTYGTLFADYYQEAFNRASGFLHDNNLGAAFIADDAKRHEITK